MTYATRRSDWSTEERFFAKTRRAANGCLEWTAHRDRKGYGRFQYRGKVESAHRVAWALAHDGELPKGHVLHRCDNPACVNIEHLFIGDQEVNMKDMARKGRGRKPGSGTLGEDNPLSSLTQQEADEIRRLYAQGGITQKQLAAKFNVTRGVIGPVLRNERYVPIPKEGIT